MGDRALYHQAKYKIALSIVFGAGSLMALAFCAAHGGESDSANYLAQRYDGLQDDELQQSQVALAGGYGFASFMWAVAFLMLMVSAIYISPLFCGSSDEKAALSGPAELNNSKLISIMRNVFFSPTHRLLQYYSVKSKESV